jgi:hypothetical protein
MILDKKEKIQIVKYKCSAVDMIQSDEPVITVYMSICVPNNVEPDSDTAKTIVREELKKHCLFAPLKLIQAESIIEYEFSPEKIFFELEFAGK